MVTKTEMEFYLEARQDFRGTNFTTHLILLIMKADVINTEKLRLGFPELVGVVKGYSNKTGYWEDLQERVKKQNNVTK